MLTFRSTELQREITINEVYELQLEETRKLHVELTMSIHMMDDAIREAFRLENEAGVPFDRDWMHKARYKRRVTIAFACEAKRRLLKLDGIELVEANRRQTLLEVQRDKFIKLKQMRIRNLLVEELGPGVYEEIESEAHEEAEAEFKAWLAEKGYKQFYVT